MKIEQSQLRLAAESHFSRQELRVRLPETRPRLAPRDTVELRAAVGVDESGEPADAKLKLMLRVAEMMLGKKIHLAPAAAASAPAAVAPAPAAAGSANGTTVEAVAEAEQSYFSARGSVRTGDGRTIQFDVELARSREFLEVNVSTPAPAGNARDPLVVNFDGRGARLLSDRFEFDLEGDGRLESLPVLARGSALLFADRDGNGSATDGSELFGPTSGQGFSELADYDADANGWIDESDAVFGQLRLWFQEPGGAGRVATLAAAGVGAISVSDTATPFELHASGNDLLGTVRSSGVYLRESGQAGVVSQVDYVVNTLA